MKDLQYLYEFENLLLEANNDLVRQGVADGKLALGYSCSFMPEVLLDLPGCFGVRLRAPRAAFPDLATYYMTNRTCLYARSLLERAIEGGYQFLDAHMGTETCAVMNRMQENMELLKLNEKEKFFVSFMDVPMKKGGRSTDHYETQIRLKVLDKLSAVYGVDVSDDAIRKAIDAHNELCRVMQAIGELRKADNPVITGYEFHVLNLITQVCPKYLVLDKLKETLEELRTREPDKKPNWRIKTVMCGSEVDDPDFTKLVEQCGALVVADRYCYGSIPGREPIEIQDGETPLRAVARHYLALTQCPRQMDADVMHARKDYLAALVKTYHADGIICEQMKFCEYWSYERTVDALAMAKLGIPCCSIEKEYNIGAAGQLRTRFQAFVESVEMKKLNAEKEGTVNG